MGAAAQLGHPASHFRRRKFDSVEQGDRKNHQTKALRNRGMTWRRVAVQQSVEPPNLWSCRRSSRINNIIRKIVSGCRVKDMGGGEGGQHLTREGQGVQ